MRRLLLAALALVALGFISAAGVIGYYYHLASDYDLKRVGSMPERSVVLDQQGTELGRLHGENRIVIGLDEVPPAFIDALLIREDQSFRSHPGIDPRGLARAFVRNLRDRRMTQGASTITMQLARNSFGLREKTIHRKLLEMALARRIENRFSKDEILIHYINRIFFGSGVYGLERASRAYFGKPAAAMTLSESALMAGIIRGPNRFAPTRHPQAALRERDTVLDRMVLAGAITGPAAEQAKSEPLTVRPQEASTPQENWALDAVRRDLDRVLDDRYLDDGGLRIHTTFDARLQQQATSALNSVLGEFEARPDYPHSTKRDFDRMWVPSGDQPYPDATPYLQGAVVLIDNQTGGVLAMVGGRDHNHSLFNRALQAERQIGSTFKPFVYAAAFGAGLLPGTLVDDDPIAPGEIAGLSSWSPRNSDGTHTGRQPASRGLVRSRNTMSVRVGTLAGLDRVTGLARSVNLDPPEDPDLQLFIGNIGATLHQLTSAYSVFPNHGIRRRPHVISRIEDAAGNIIYECPRLSHRAMPEAIARLTTSILEDVMRPGGTASGALPDRFSDNIGGKTGTTNDFHDAWFVGFNQRLTCGVWSGFDQPRSIAPSAYGSRLALPVWAEVMQTAAEAGWTPGPVTPPSTPMQTVEVCRETGRLATIACRRRGDAYEIRLPYELIPADFCRVGDNPTTSPERRSIWRRLRNWLSQ